MKGRNGSFGAVGRLAGLLSGSTRCRVCGGALPPSGGDPSSATRTLKAWLRQCPDCRRRKILGSLGGAGSLLVLALLVLPAGAGGGESVLDPLLPDDPTVGAKLFVEKGCVRCHSTSPEELPGREKPGPDLGRTPLKGGLLEVAAALWNHAPVMTDKMQELKILRPEFTPQQMANLVAYLAAYMRYLNGVGEPGDPVRGQKLFHEKACAACHTLGKEAQSKGAPSLGRFAGPISPIAMAQAMWNHGPRMTERMAQLGLERPRFRNNEMLDLLAYVQAEGKGTAGTYAYVEPGSPRRGHDLFREKGCIRCHSVNGAGGRGGPDLGRMGGEFAHSVGELAGRLWNHGPAMWSRARALGVAIPSFSGNEMADVIAYLYYLSYLDPAGDPDRGGRLFFEKGCGQCHAIRGKGGQVGPDLTLVPAMGSPVEIVAAMWNHVPFMKRSMGQRGIPWPRFEPGEFRDVIAYIRAQRP